MSNKSRSIALALVTLAAAASAQAQEKFSFTTNWYAQAEHGGFYQALATGLYQKAGLDVSIRMGGPQVNIMQLMAAGQTDCVMGYDMQTIKGWEQGINAVTVAAAFQKDPQVLIGHPGVLNKLEDLKLTLFVVIGVLSIFPTMTFIRWRKRLRAGGVLPPEAEVAKARKLVMIQAHLLALIPLAAVFLARGFGK